MLLRAATEADLPGILAIYNEVVANSTAVYSETAATSGRPGGMVQNAPGIRISGAGG